MQQSINTNPSFPADYALPPGIPALQTDPARLQRGHVLRALALALVAVSLGYFLGQSQLAGPVLRPAAVHTLR